MELKKEKTFKDLGLILNTFDIAWINQYLHESNLPAETSIRHNNDAVLLYASLHNKSTLVSMLLTNGANPHKKCGGGDSLLATAAEKGYTEIVKLLINAGVNRLEADKSNLWMPSAALCKATACGHFETVKLLLELTPWNEEFDAQARKLANQYDQTKILALFPQETSKEKQISNRIEPVKNTKPEPLTVSLGSLSTGNLSVFCLNLRQIHLPGK